MGVGREINSAVSPFGDNGHELRGQPAGFTLFADVLKGNICAAKKTACAIAIDGAVGSVLAAFDFKANFIGVDNRVGENILLGRELEGVNERHFVIASGIGASDGTRPKPRDNGFAVRLSHFNHRAKYFVREEFFPAESAKKFYS